ncbi:MAG: ribbon-helix-helix domain-containing protein [Gemmatimonas sp.]
MRTTIRLEDSLLREAKSLAARGGRSLNDFIEEAIRLAVLSAAPADAAPAIPVFTGGRGVHPGVELDSHADLLDVMDDGADAR